MYRETYKGYSPWGGIQHSTIIMRGLKYVSTAGHGGYMVTKNFANKHLSKPCINLGEEYGDYLCYEEDCAWALVNYDLLKYNPNIYSLKIKNANISIEDAELSLRKNLSIYYPNYLIEIGVEPSKEEYEVYLIGIKRDKMRAEKNPDLIISAVSVKNGIVKVWTADSEIHYVETTSYQNLRENSNLLLLSKCNLVQYE